MASCPDLLVSRAVFRYLRNPSSRLRSALLLMACAALAMHAAVPAGFMLDLDRSTGELVYVLCPSQGAAPDSPAHSGIDEHPEHSQTGAPHPSYEMPSEVCDFAVASAPPILATSVTVATALGISIEPVIEYRLIAPPSISSIAASSRGPPHYS